MWIVRLALRRPYTFVVMAVLIAILGTSAIFTMPVDIRGIGNWLRPRYDRVDVETVWNTVIDDLPPLRSAVQSALTPPPANPEGPA